MSDLTLKMIPVQMGRDVFLCIILVSDVKHQSENTDRPLVEGTLDDSFDVKISLLPFWSQVSLPP